MSLEIAPIGKGGYEEWDRFVEQSPQGNIFSLTKWLKLFDKEYWILGCRNGTDLCGGIAYFSDDNCYSGGSHCILTPFQGVLVRPPNGSKPVTVLSLQNKVTEAIIEELSEFKKVEISNHYTFPDVRPFIWNKYKQEVRYTMVVDISDLDKTWEMMESDTRNLIRKAENEGLVCKQTTGISAFIRLYAETFSRKKQTQTVSNELVQKIYKNIDNALFLVYQDKEPIAGVMMIWDNKRAHYLFGASLQNDIGASYLGLWEAMKEMSKTKNEVDLGGVNNRDIGLFKRGFGGELKQYIQVTKT